MSVPRQNFALVQALRGIAAFWVALFHASAGGHLDHLHSRLPWLGRQIIDLGDNGVAIFFALSGFVIAHSIQGDRITPGYVGRFALRRSIRLDPALWASILLFLTFAPLSAWVKGEVLDLPSTGQVLANMTYTQLFLGYPSINTVYWTLCYEVQFYLVLVCCVMAAQRFGSWPYLLAFAVALLFGGGMLANPLPGLFVDLWHGFFLGALAYWSYERKIAAYAFAFLALALLLLAPSAFTITCVVTALGLTIAHRTGAIYWAPRSLVALGAISYSLYLIHNPISGASFYLLAKAGAPQWSALILTLAACIVAATVLWWAVERPTAALARRVSLRRSLPPVHAEPIEPVAIAQ